MAKTKFIRTGDSDKMIVDANLKADKALYLPVFSSGPNLNNNPDEPGAFGYDATIGKVVIYQGGGVWTPVGTSPFVGKYASLSALQTAVPTGVDGNYAIVTASPHDQEYIWDSDATAWVLTQNIPASTFALLGGSPTDNTALAAVIASLNTADSTEASARASADTALQSEISALSAALIPHPTYNNPSAGISSSQSNSGLEIGQTINIPLTASFNQNDAGAASGYTIKKNGTTLASASTYTDSGVTITSSAINYSSAVAYAQGPVKNNLLGIPDAVGQIASGSVNSGNLSYQGSYKMYWGSVAALPTTSAQVKSLSNQLRSQGNSFNLNTGTANKIFVIVLPPGVSLSAVIDTGNLNLDIKSDYTANTSSITVTDGGGNNVTYTMYAKIQSVAYNPATNHQITTT